MKQAILGTGGHAKSIYDIIKNKKNVNFFDKKNKFFKINNNKFIVKSEDILLNNYHNKISKIIIAIGDNKTREKKYNILKKKNLNLQHSYTLKHIVLLDLK